MRNKTGEPLVILGYQGEPYLAFRDGRVYRTTCSPATYLNDDRFGRVALPKQADAKAPPGIRPTGFRLARPPHPLDEPVAAAQGRSGQGQAATSSTGPSPRASTESRSRSTGSLDYQPPPNDLPKPLLVVLGLVIVGGAAAVWLRRRRGREEAEPLSK